MEGFVNRHKTKIKSLNRESGLEEKYYTEEEAHQEVKKEPKPIWKKT